MAQQDKETYDSYAKDAFDNPPAGPMGVHRGARSAASHAMPYVIVVVVALLAGLLFWGIYSGEIGKLKMPWSSSQASSSQTASTKKTATAEAQSSDTATATQTPDATGEASDTASPTESATPEQIVNKDTQIRVINATNVTGYAQSKANELTNAGYTSVTPSNPTGTVPTQTVVWYQNETDKATAEDVAQTLGITNVEQSDGLVTPIVVVLLN